MITKGSLYLKYLLQYNILLKIVLDLIENDTLFFVLWKIIALSLTFSEILFNLADVDQSTSS